MTDTRPRSPGKHAQTPLRSGAGADWEELLGDDLLALIHARGVPLARCTVITALPSPVRKRGAFALDFADGSRLKGRRLESAERADRWARLRSEIGAGFARILARQGEALLLEWAPGQSLAAHTAISPDVLRRCGQMLGALHTGRSGRELGGTDAGLDELVSKLERNLVQLREAGRIDPELARRALDAAAGERPASASEGIILRDFCAENIVLSDDGALVCIDDAALSVGPHDLDVARTWYRWPMESEARDRFEAGYEEHRSLAGFREHLRFWATCVLVGSAAVRLRARAAGGLEPIERLRQIHAAARPAASARAPLPSADFRYEELVVRVSAADRGDLRWLSAFLACGFEELGGGAPHAWVELAIDPTAYDRRLEAGHPGRGERVEGFAKDAEPDWLERWPSDGSSSSVYHDARRAAFYEVSRDGMRVGILARERTRQCRTTLMRVVRELAMNHAVSSGAILVHGSVVGFEHGAVVMSGPRRSGKTTLLMSLLETPGTAYIANDRCAVRVREGELRVRGVPTLVSIRSDTLEHFPASRARLDRIRPDLAGARRIARASFSLSPPEFCELMGDRPRGSEAPLRALVFPQVTADAPRLALRRLGAAEALERLRQGLFRAGRESPLGEAFAARRALPPAPEALRAIAGSVPAFDCRLGGGGAPPPEACRELLAAVSS